MPFALAMILCTIDLGTFRTCTVVRALDLSTVIRTGKVSHAISFVTICEDFLAVLLKLLILQGLVKSVDTMPDSKTCSLSTTLFE